LRLGVPVRLIDGIFLLYSWMLYGDLSGLGFSRPEEGPMEVKLKEGKTPVLDVGTLSKIKSGHIKVFMPSTPLKHSVSACDCQWIFSRSSNELRQRPDLTFDFNL
jgi:hypothetical protein